MIASDMNNPNFQGAHDPDSRLAVKFYSRPLKNEFETAAKQRPIFVDIDFVEITTPGNTLNVIDTPVRDEHKARFHRQWAAYTSRKDTSTHLMGTPVTEWTRVTPAQAEELRGMKFFTVEAIAGASDAQLQSIGMIAGSSAYTFRDEARRFLSVAEAASKLEEADRKEKDSETRMAEMRLDFEAQTKAQNERMDALLKIVEEKAGMPAAQEQKPEPTDQFVKRGSGRPPENKAA